MKVNDNVVVKAVAGAIVLAACLPQAIALPVGTVERRQMVPGMLTARVIASERREAYIRRQIEQPKWLPRDSTAKRTVDGPLPNNMRRDRFAPIGYPVRGLIRRADDDEKTSLSSATSIAPKTTDGNETSKAPGTATPASTSAAAPGSNTSAAEKEGDKKDGSKDEKKDDDKDEKKGEDKDEKKDGDNAKKEGAVKLPDGIDYGSTGFVFLPVQNKDNGEEASKDGASSSQPSRQTYFFNVEAPMAGGSGSKPAEQPKKDDKKEEDCGCDDDDGGKKDAEKKPDDKAPAGGGPLKEDKIVFKPLQDPDKSKEADKSAEGGVMASKAGGTEEPHPAAAEGSKTTSEAEKPSEAKSADDTASSSKTASSPPSAPANGPATGVKPLPSGDDNYYLFPVTDEKEQVSLNKGDMVAYVDHPPTSTIGDMSKGSSTVSSPSSSTTGSEISPEKLNSPPAAESPEKKSVTSGRRQLVYDEYDRRGIKNNVKVVYRRDDLHPRETDNGGGKGRQWERFKRALVPGDPEAKIGYWTGDQIRKKRGAGTA